MRDDWTQPGRPASRQPGKAKAKLLLIAAACTLVMIAADFWRPMTMLDRMELRTVDWRFHYRGPLAPHSDIVLVAVDEESIGKVGMWPWSRAVFAELTERLNAAGARAIIYDIFFVERDPDSAEDDDLFVAAVAAAGNVYLAGVAHDMESAGSANPQSGDQDASDAQSTTGPGRAGIEQYGWSQTEIAPGRGLLAWAKLHNFADLTYPFPKLASAAQGVGYTALWQTGDGVFRYTPAVAQCRGYLHASLPVKVAADLLGIPPDEVTVRLGQRIALGEQTSIPLDRGGWTTINFMGKEKTYPHFPAWQFLQPSPAGSTLNLQDKIVLVIVTAKGLLDVRASPFGDQLTGGEVQATILDNILTQRHLQRLLPEQRLLVLVFIGLYTGLIFAFLPTAPALGYSLSLLLVYNWLGMWAFAYRGMIVDLFVPTVTGVITILALVSYRLLREESQRSRAHQTLSRFVPAQIVSQLMEDQAAQTLQGQRRVVSVLFCDLRNFTAASERLKPEATVTLLNRYFALMHEVIWEFEGTLDKFLGDGLMAFFNAPMDQPDHALRAVQTAIEMQRRIEFNRAEWEFCGWPQLAAGIGISTGEAVVGYITSRERMQYTAIGAQVNLASRLEELTKELGAEILISETTYQLVKDAVETEFKGNIAVHGFAEEVRIYSANVPLK